VSQLPWSLQMGAMRWTRTTSPKAADAAIGRMRQAAATARRISAEVVIAAATAPLMGPLSGVRYVGRVFRTPVLRGAAWGAGTDGLSQGVALVTGDQRRYDVARTGGAAVVGGLLDAAGRIWRWLRGASRAPATGRLQFAHLRRRLVAFADAKASRRRSPDRQRRAEYPAALLPRSARRDGTVPLRRPPMAGNRPTSSGVRPA
jgi:hypothetical protein